MSIDSFCALLKAIVVRKEFVAYSFDACAFAGCAHPTTRSENDSNYRSNRPTALGDMMLLGDSYPHVHR